jgi:UDP-N-acetylglucosamine 2-epimerase (non-hydrolysing)
MTTIHLVAGARPNFIKIAPIIRALQSDGLLSFKIVHTGQHYDRDMNQVFFDELGIPTPDASLGAGAGTHAEQTGRIMTAYEELCAHQRPDCTLVVGDVNSTLACAIVAKKACIPVAHVEAGLRSGDMTMPEEINRIVTDAIADWFFVSEPSGIEHLVHEGKSLSAIFHVGQVMVDTLLFQAQRLERMDPSSFETSRFKTQHSRYGVVTLHRPSNVDTAQGLEHIGHALRTIAVDLPLIFPVHPRTRGNLKAFGVEFGPNVQLVSPRPYMEFLNLWKDAVVVLTDSGGMQEETTALGVPCVTVRANTERPITVKEGTNVIAGTDPKRVVAEVQKVLTGNGKVGRRPQLWDGKAAERIVAELVRLIPSAHQ